METWGKPAAVLATAVMLFVINGAEAVEGFLKSDSSQEILGVLGTVLVVVLGVLVGKKGPVGSPTQRL